MTSILAALLLTGSPVRSRADGSYAFHHIYLYETNSAPHDVTSTYYYQEGHIYLFDPNAIEVVLDYQEGHVYALNGTVIGFICLTHNTDPNTTSPLQPF